MAIRAAGILFDERIKLWRNAILMGTERLPSAISSEDGYGSNQIRIRVTDKSSPNSIQLLEAGVQLLDAFDRFGTDRPQVSKGAQATGAVPEQKRAHRRESQCEERQI
jgi:hypothetical protein